MADAPTPPGFSPLNTPPARAPPGFLMPLIVNVTAEQRRAANTVDTPPTAPRRRGRPPKIRSSVQKESTVSHDKGQISINSKRKRDGITTRASVSQDVDLTKILDAIEYKYGDLIQNCPYESQNMKTSFSLSICKVVRELQHKRLEDVDVSMLDSYYKDVRDAEKLNMNVQWLRQWLDEIKDVISSRDEVKGQMGEKDRREEDFLVREKEIVLREGYLKRVESEICEREHQLELLKEEKTKIASEIRDMKDRQAKESLLIERLKLNKEELESKATRFQQYSSLIDGLL